MHCEPQAGGLGMTPDEFITTYGDTIPFQRVLKELGLTKQQWLERVKGSEKLKEPYK